MAIASPAAPTATPKSRRRLLFVGALVLLFAAAPVGYYLFSHWLQQRELEAVYREIDAEEPDWRFADLGAAMPEPPPDEQNAAVQLLRVRDLLVKAAYKPPVWVTGKWKHLPNARLAEAEAAAIRAGLLKAGPTALEEARKLKDLPEGRFRFEVVENPLDGVKPADLDPRLLSGMNLLEHDIRLRAHDRDFEGAAESCLALLHAAHAINDYPQLMAQLIRAAGQDTAAASLERTLGQGMISEQRLAALQHALAREAEHNALYDAMRGERAWCQRTYVLAEEGKISYRDFVGPGRNPTLRDHVNDLFRDPLLRGHADQLRLSNELVQASKLPEEARAKAFQAVAKNALGNPNPLARGVGLLAGQAAEFQKTHARLRCAVTALAAERYRLAHDRWPQNAEELVTAGLLNEALKDPFDGQPLRWKQTPTAIAIYAPTPTPNVAFELWRPEMRGMPASVIGRKP